jgi:hypothetical protein
LACPKCAGQMKVVAFIESRQADVIEKIMRHCGLWHPAAPRPPPADCHGTVPLTASEPRERTYVDMETFWATF